MKLNIHDVTQRYGSLTAVKEVNLELTTGVYGLLGPNGAGKTTLMRIIADVLQPTEGYVALDGESTAKLAADYRALIGYLPQDCGFYKAFTAKRFLQYMAAIKGLPAKQADQKINEVLEKVNLTEAKGKKIRTFSGGMKQRLGIAQALLNDPSILILDEPTAGLDPKERVRFRNMISDIAVNRIVLLSTHIVSDIEYIAKEVLIMKEGAVIRQAHPMDILRELEGKVWRVEWPASRLRELEERALVGGLVRKDDMIEARVVADECPSSEAMAESATLEDMYLYFFGESDEEGTAS